MNSFSLDGVVKAALVGITLLMVGCSASTRVLFDGPRDGVIFVNTKPYHLPAQVELERPGTIGESKRYDVSLVFTGPQSKEVRTKGYIDMIGYNESEADRQALPTCHLDETQLVKTLDGTVIIFKGQSASRQPIYELTLRKQ
jgi:hypothetical protein